MIRETALAGLSEEKTIFGKAMLLMLGEDFTNRFRILNFHIDFLIRLRGRKV